MKYDPKIKPSLWNITPVDVAYNCRKHGFPYPVLVLPMWEKSGDTIFDLSGNDNRGVFVGGTGWTEDRLVFDGTNDLCHLEDLDEQNFEFANNFTIELILNTKTPINQYDITISCCTESGRGWRLWTRDISSQVYYWEAYDGSAKNVKSTTLMNDVFVHVVAVHDGSNLRLYINGVEEGTPVAVGDVNYIDGSSVTRTTIGAMPETSTGLVFRRFGNHDIKIARIYDTVLDPGQIRFLASDPYFMLRPLDYSEFCTDFSSGITLTCTTGTLNIAGVNANIFPDIDIEATTGTINLTNINASIHIGVLIDCTTSNINLTSINADIFPDIDIEATTGTINVTSINADIFPDIDIEATTSNINLTSINADIFPDIDIEATTGTINVTGVNADIFPDIDIEATTGIINVTGVNADIFPDIDIEATTGTINISVHNAEILLPTSNLTLIYYYTLMQ